MCIWRRVKRRRRARGRGSRTSGIWVWEVFMIVAAIVMMALAQAPASSTSVSGQVVDAEGRPAAGVEVLLSGLARVRHGDDRCSRGRSPIMTGRFRIDVPAEKDSRQARLMLALWAYAPKEGLAGQAFSPSALPAPGSVQLKLGGPAHTTVRVAGPDGKPVAGARVAPVMVRVAGGFGPIRRSRRPTRSPTCSRPRPTPTARGKSRAVEPRTSMAVWVEAAGFGRPGKRARRGCRRRPGDHTEARRPADRPRSGRRPIRGAGVGGRSP